MLQLAGISKAAPSKYAAATKKVRKQAKLDKKHHCVVACDKSFENAWSLTRHIPSCLSLLSPDYYRRLTSSSALGVFTPTYR
ncbi:hypothetical protein LZ30DRAFT_196704, partial [Colletotrichum cereale]